MRSRETTESELPGFQGPTVKSQKVFEVLTPDMAQSCSNGMKQIGGDNTHPKPMAIGDSIRGD